MLKLYFGRMKKPGDNSKMWYVWTENAPSDQQFRLIGATVQDQMVSCQNMATQMMADVEYLQTHLGQYVELGDFEAEEVYTQFFAPTYALWWETEEEYVVPEEGAALIEFMLEVGEALIDLAVAAM